MEANPFWRYRGKNMRLFALGLSVAWVAPGVERHAHASTCDAYAFVYELVEVRAVAGAGDATTQTLWAEGAHFEPRDDEEAVFRLFTEKDPEGEVLRLRRIRE